MVEYVGQPQYTLAPAFLCPFGWPTEPSYPIDVEASITNTDGGSSTKQSERSNPTSHLRKTWTYLFGSEESKADEEDINRIYLEALYLPDSYATPHQVFHQFISPLPKSFSLVWYDVNHMHLFLLFFHGPHKNHSILCYVPTTHPVTSSCPYRKIEDHQSRISS